jgi:hypothetical protein
VVIDAEFGMDGREIRSLITAIDIGLKLLSELIIEPD